MHRLVRLGLSRRRRFVYLLLDGLLLGGLLLTLLPVVPLFVAWDLYAISRHHWSFDAGQVVGVDLPGGLPVEEVAFFVVVPLAAVLTLEAVRAVRGWRAGDER